MSSTVCKKRFCLIFGLLITGFIGLFTSNPAYAITDGEINYIVLQNQAQTCYSSSTMYDKITTGFSLETAFKKKGSIVLLKPGGVGATYSCLGAFQTMGKNPTARDLGYTLVAGDSSTSGPIARCVTMKYSLRGASYDTDKICLSVRGNDIDMSEAPRFDARATKPGPINLSIGGNNTIDIDYPTPDGIVTSSTSWYARTWSEFESNIKAAASGLNGTFIKTGTNPENGQPVGSDLENSHIEPSVADNNPFETYEIKDFEAAKKTMMSYYFGNSAAPTLGQEAWQYLLDTAYKSAFNNGAITEGTCVDSKSAALAQGTSYAFYKASENKWCPVSIQSTDKNGNYTYNTKYALVAPGYRSLKFYSIEEVLKLQTNRDLGNQTSEDACAAKANARLEELRNAGLEEYRQNGLSSRYKFLVAAVQQLTKMINDGKLMNSNGSCADLPSQNEDAQSQKDTCTAQFNIAISQWENRLNDRNLSANEKAIAQDRLDKIAALNGAYWTEEDNGEIVCRNLNDVYNGIIDDDDGSPPGGDSSGGTAGTFDGCFNNGGALAWIICPVLRIAGDAMDGIYQSIADNYLTIKSTTMTSDALRGVWSKFQGYANIIFAILLVFVILSQVTGIGLSNYGIKKVLPRLIITIVLVNLSFLICSVAVDLSNILGTSLNDLFTKWDVGNYAASNLNAGTMISNTVESLFSVGAVTGVTILGIKIAAASGALEGIILTLLLTVVVALVSIIFFYIILGVRQAAVILLVAVSPVAIVCYALPNTQKFFSRWLKIFSSLLLVFPICGLLMGGSNFASRLLLEAAGSEVSFMYFLVAMLLSVVPLFFVPTVLKSSMSAMGNLGMKLSNMGTRLGNWSSRTIRGTRAFQERQQEAMRNSNMTRNSRIMDKTELSDADKTRLKTLRDKQASGATLTSDERRDLRRLSSRAYRYARASAARERLVAEDAMAEVTSMHEPLEHGSARYEKMIAGATREQRNKDDAGQVALYEEGKVTAFDGSGNVVKADSLADLKSEHLALLQHVADHPEDEAAASKLRAVQTLLGRTGPKGFDAMEDNIGNLMANHGQFDNTNSQGIRLATAHLTRNFAGQIKANSRTFDKMLMDFNSDNFAQQSSFSQQTFTDGLGDSQTKFLSSHYSAKGAQSIKADNVNDLGDTYYDNLLHATINGHLKGKDLEQVLNVFNEAETAADAGKLTLKGEVRRRIKAIKDVAYASSNGSASGGRSEGSLMIGSASPAGIDSIVKQIESAGDWSTMNNDDRKRYSDLVNNITDSLRQDAHTVEDVRQLQQALDIANGKNIETAVTGGSKVTKVSTGALHSFKIPRGSKQRINMPANWKKVGNNWIDVSTGGPLGTPLSQEDAAKAEKILEHNASVDVDEGNV